jgi:hypothetical protein
MNFLENYTPLFLFLSSSSSSSSFFLSLSLSLPLSLSLSQALAPLRNLKSFITPGLVAHAFNPSIREAGGFLSSRTAWSTKEFQDSQGYTEKPCLEKPKKKKKKKEKKRKESFITPQHPLNASTLNMYLDFTPYRKETQGLRRPINLGIRLPLPSTAPPIPTTNPGSREGCEP